MNREFNNKDFMYVLGRGELSGLKLMLQSLEPHNIVRACSPVHVQSVLEDLQKLSIDLILKLEAKEPK